MKLDGRLWIKASGKWMADATRDDFLSRLDLGEVNQMPEQKVDPAERFRSASIETAMHAVLPHRVVLHVHSVNTIAWAVRQDASSNWRTTRRYALAVDPLRRLGHAAGLRNPEGSIDPLLTHECSFWETTVW